MARSVVVCVSLLLVLGLLVSEVSAARQHRFARHKKQPKHAQEQEQVEDVNAAATATLTVDVTKPKFAASPLLFGAFYEELNHAGYGGLHAELLQNGLFQQNTTNPWTKSTGCTLTLDATDPLTPNNTNSLLIQSSSSAACSISNAGYYGIAVKPSVTYSVSFWAKTHSRLARDTPVGRHAATTSVTVGFQAKNGGAVYAQANVAITMSMWMKYTTQIEVPSTVTLDPTGVFFLSVPAATTLSVHVVSVMEGSGWQGLPLRADLAQFIADMHPHVLRFPGGCYVEGHQRAGAWRWKQTIGPIENRPGHPGFWGYWSPDHLGAYEYLVLSEIIGAEPIFVVNAGMSYEGDDVPVAQMGEFVQDALDAIEFCNGDSTTYWGAKRAALGHPEPFNLKYMAIGNEEDKLMSEYALRYPLFYNAIKAAYPEFNVIATTPRVLSSYGYPFDLYDYHLYSTPVNVANAISTFDNANRSQPVFASEFAVQGGSNDTVNYYTLVAALAEAQYMIGLEHNSDVVKMAAYAPLFVNAGDKNWQPDAIMFNTYQSFGSPSYYQQVLYSSRAGCTLLPAAVATSANIVVNSAVSAIRNNLVISATSRPVQTDEFLDCTPTGSSEQEVVVKLVYWGATDLTATFNVTIPANLNVQKSAAFDYLGNAYLWTANTLTDPQHIVPQHVTQSIAPIVVGNVASFTLTVPAQSSSVLTLTLA